MIKYIISSVSKDVHVLHPTATDNLRFSTGNGGNLVSYCRRRLPAKTSNVISFPQVMDNICPGCKKSARKYIKCSSSEKDNWDQRTSFNDFISYWLDWFREFLPSSPRRLADEKFKFRFMKHLDNEKIYKQEKFRSKSKRR